MGSFPMGLNQFYGLSKFFNILMGVGTFSKGFGRVPYQAVDTHLVSAGTV